MSDLRPELLFVLGTRPEIIKLAPLIHTCDREGYPFAVAHTGQHYSEELDSVFFEQLELPEPEFNLEVGSSSHGRQTGEMMIGLESTIERLDPDVVLVQGDTNSVLAGALVTSKMDPVLGHVEAGLRSFDERMPEETNRVVADHVGDHLFAPTERARAFLREEGIETDRIHVTGNTIVDALHRYEAIVDSRSEVLADLGVEAGEFYLLTAHREENVDVRGRFSNILEGVDRVARDRDRPVIYPIHPRARANLERFDLAVPDSIRLIDPVTFLDFLQLERSASLVITDSGGVQEETCILGTPCLTVRESTERPETIDVGANRLVGTDPDAIVSAAVEMEQTALDWENPFGDGTASDQILKVLRRDGPLS